MASLIEFINVYRLYRWHSRRYAFRAAWRIVINKVPF